MSYTPERIRVGGWALLEPYPSLSERNRIKERLVFQTPPGYKGEPPTTVRAYADDPELGIFCVPRAWALRRWPDCTRVQAFDWGDDIDLQFDEEKASAWPTWEEQKATIDKTYCALQDGPHLGGILLAPPGSGKTIMSTALICALGRTALILVHKEFLADQWVDALTDFAGLSADDIGWVRQERCDYEGKPVTIAMIQSLVSGREYPREFYHAFGMAVADEAHRYGSPAVWHRVLSMFGPAYRLGVTATKRRKDGMEALIRHHIGPVVARISGHPLAPKIKLVRYGGTYPVEEWESWASIKRRRKKPDADIEIDRTKAVRAISKRTARNKLVIGQLLKATKAGRTSLVLSERRDHLDTLHNMAGKELPPWAKLGFFVGGQRKADREFARNEARIIFGTYHQAAEALDIPRLDTLFLATPRSDVYQPVGRILREHEDKKDPIVVDFLDETVEAAVGWYWSRCRHYAQHGAKPPRP